MFQCSGGQPTKSVGVHYIDISGLNQEGLGPARNQISRGATQDIKKPSFYNVENYILLSRRTLEQSSGKFGSKNIWNEVRVLNG